MSPKKNWLYKLNFKPTAKPKKSIDKEPPPIQPKGAVAEGESDPVREMAEYLGGTSEAWTLARRIMEEIYPHHPTATTPELVAYDFLAQRNIPFLFQPTTMGGRAFRGGLVPDIVVRSTGGEGIAWLIQGEYWHNKRRNPGRDASARVLLLGADVGGIRIKSVVELWERDIIKKRPQVFNLALEGIGLRT